MSRPRGCRDRKGRTTAPAWPPLNPPPGCDEVATKAALVDASVQQVAPVDVTLILATRGALQRALPTRQALPTGPFFSNRHTTRAMKGAWHILSCGDERATCELGSVRGRIAPSAARKTRQEALDRSC